MPPRRRIAALLALAASRAQVNDGWSCDGPLPSVHGQRSGDLVDGGFEVLLHRHPLHPREAHAEIMGSTVELELVGPAGLAGFLMAPSKGKVPSAEKRNKYTVEFDLPHKHGDVDLKVVAQKPDSTWYSSTMHFYIGEEDETAKDHLRNGTRQLVFIVCAITSILSTTLYLGISAWPTDAPHVSGKKYHFH